MTWHGWRLTLNCGHFELTDLENRQVGQLTTCDMCPLVHADPQDMTNRATRAMRQIVNRQPVEAPQEPDSLDPLYWYGT